MSLRDADSLHLESRKVPELRRRGRAEPMALPELEHALVESFVLEVTSETDRAMLAEGSVAVAFADPDGGTYTVSIHRVEGGYQLVARRAALARAAPAKPASMSSPAASASPAQTSPSPVTASPERPPAPSAAPERSLEALVPGPCLCAAVEEAASRRASDVLLSTGGAVRLRIDGALEALPELSCDEAELRALFRAAVGLGSAREHCVGLAPEHGAADFACDVSGVRVRGNVFSHAGGVGVSVRLLPGQPPLLADLDLPPSVASALSHREGLVLVCGATGSGKTTTAASLLRQLDLQRAAHLITLEDPIEYRLVARRGLVHQRELGVDFSSFAAGLRAALRESPDALFVGELRDAESIAAALTAAETGHLVLATMHAPGAAGAVDRILDSFDERRQRQVRTQLAGALRLVVTQVLVPRQGGGRVAAAEVVPVTSAVANIIRKGELQTLATAIQSGRDAGLVPLERSLASLVQRGLLAEAEARRVAADVGLLRAQLG